MKNRLLITFLMLPWILSGQSFKLNEETRLLTYEQIIQVDTMTAVKLFDKTKEWIILSFKSSEDVIVGENSPTTIKAIFIQQYLNGGPYAPYYNTLTIKIKDGAVKVTVDDIHMTSGYRLEPIVFKKDGTRKPALMYNKIYEDVEIKLFALGASLKSYLLSDGSW